jgi:hypothetical protein
VNVVASSREVILHIWKRHDNGYKNDLVTQHLIVTFQCVKAVLFIPKTVIDIVHTLICAHITQLAFQDSRLAICVSSFAFTIVFQNS